MTSEMRKKPEKFINLQRIYAVMFIPALNWRAGNAVISQENMHDIFGYVYLPLLLSLFSIV